MALFDIAHMGKSLVSSGSGKDASKKKKKKKQQKQGGDLGEEVSDAEASAAALREALSGDEDETGDDGAPVPMESAISVAAVKTASKPDDGDLGAGATAALALDGQFSDTDVDHIVTDDVSDSGASHGSAHTEGSFGRIITAGKSRTLRTVTSLYSMTPGKGKSKSKSKQPADDEGDDGDAGDGKSKALASKSKSKGEQVGDDAASVGSFDVITVRHSNDLSLAAHRGGFGPAFRLLKLMTRADRETIMGLLLIKRKATAPNDEVDAYDILFRGTFGIRARTNSALRQVRVLSQSTWVHSLLKVATALKMSRTMVVSSGDWRIPTRLTSGVSNARAKKASGPEFEMGDSPTLDKVEHKLYRNLQRSVEGRLGAETVNKLRALVIDQADGELADVLRAEDVVAKAKQAKLAKKKKKKRAKKKDGDDDDEEGAAKMAGGEDADDEGDDGDAVDGEDDVGASAVSMTMPAPSATPAKPPSPTPFAMDEEVSRLGESFHIPQMIDNIESAKPGFGRYVLLLLEVFALRAKTEAKAQAKRLAKKQEEALKKGLKAGSSGATAANADAGGDDDDDDDDADAHADAHADALADADSFVYANQQDFLKKMALVGAKDGFIGLSLGIPLATFVNPFLGFPLMTMSFINLTLGSTEMNIIEPVCMIMVFQLVLASNGTSVHDL